MPIKSLPEWAVTAALNLAGIALDQGNLTEAASWINNLEESFRASYDPTVARSQFMKDAISEFKRLVDVYNTKFKESIK